MSFILDALRKSENERQQQGGADFSHVPSSEQGTRGTHWLWMLGLLLLVNFAILLGLLLRQDAKTVTPPAKVEPAAVPVEQSPADGKMPTFAEQVATARQNQPQPTVAARDDSATTVAIDEPAAPVSSTSYLPTIDQLRLDGSLTMAELHVDIHVFSEVPSERFVFINMVKHRERSKLAEGPVVKEITPDGVVLEYQGRKFLLPRE